MKALEFVFCCVLASSFILLRSGVHMLLASDVPVVNSWGGKIIHARVALPVFGLVKGRLVSVPVPMSVCGRCLVLVCSYKRMQDTRKISASASSAYICTE